MIKKIDTGSKKRTKVIGLALVAAIAVPSVGALAVAHAQPTDATSHVSVSATMPPTGSVGQLTQHTPAAEKQWTKQYMKSEYGWGPQQFSALVKLWNKESNWHYKEKNASSGAYGIPQSLPGKKMATAGKDWKTNPETQIEWGLKYIKRTYGTPTAAWAHSEANNWY